MKTSILVDTNVLVYAYDRSEPAKQARAFAVLEELAAAKKGVLSSQVLSEFFVTVTRKIPAPLTVAQANVRVQNYLRAWPVLDVTGLVVLEAIRGVREHRLAYWDAQIWAVARLNQIEVILSEDFAAGSVLEGIRFLNPFAPGFDLTGLV
ncbi:twitching motility protein PilT [Clostridiales bacterium PH28_bin88]|nr:twitching motility protein PilT [Clostridiales bacterium PH28_bin88]